MSRASRALEALICGLRGQPLVTDDWASVLALANRTLLTPALFASLTDTRQVERLPPDVRDYLAFIHACNRERNERLRTQLLEAVAALNRCGVTPLVLKGAVPLFLSPADAVPVRMTSDLDLAVHACEAATARSCLENLGYVELGGARGMARPQDAGLLELRPDWGNEPEPASTVEREGRYAAIPTAQSRATRWIMHDLFKEGDYWRGRLDLRHLHDLARLAESEEVDWAALRARMPGETARNALDTHLLALHHYFGTSVPMERLKRPIVRFQHWRRAVTARHPVIAAPLRLAGNFAWGTKRVFHSRDLVTRGPMDFARRAARGLLISGSKV